MKVYLKENQISKLITNYKLVNEQSVGFNPITKTETVNFSAVWRAGYWKMTSNQIQNLNNQMKVIQNFLSKNPQTKLTIQVEAGESKVTNNDNESGGKAVPEGYLSDKRGKSMVTYLNNFFKKLENAGMSFTYPEIPKAKTIVGSTPYVRGKDNPKDPKYTPEQFVRLKVTASSQSECLIGLEVMIGYLGKGGHTCDEALFELLMNGVSLGIANLNNGDKDIRGFTTAPKVGRDLLIPVRSQVKIINQKLSSVALASERKKFRDWRTANRTSDVNTYVFAGKTIGEFGGYPRYVKYVDTYFKKNPPNGLIMPTSGEFNEDFLNKMVELRSKLNIPFKESQITYLKKVIGLSWDPKENRSFGDYKSLHKKLTSLPGRKTDGRIGGSRTQTFVINNAKAKEIFDQGKITDNKIILSLKPLVGSSGPYKQYFSKGSHSDVPFVKISKSGEEKPKYRGYPSVSIERGNMEEKTLLETDLCGNPITR